MTSPSHQHRLRAYAVRRQQLSTALVHGTARTWRQTRRTLPAIITGFGLGVVYIVGTAGMAAYELHQQVSITADASPSTAALAPEPTFSLSPGPSPVPSPAARTGTASPRPASINVLRPGDQIVATGDWNRDQHTDLLVRDPDGTVYLLAGSGGKLTARKKITSGFGADYTFAGMADWDRDGYQDLIARYNPTGDLWLYTGANTTGGLSGDRHLIGTGWGLHTFAGVTDSDRDGHQDIIAREDQFSILWLYPGESTRTGSVQQRVQIGTGWTGNYTLLGTIDWDNDHAPDILTCEVLGQSQRLLMYSGSGTRGPYTGNPYQYDLGTNCRDRHIRAAPDLNNDGKPDLIVGQTDDSPWIAYPGNSKLAVGNPWTIATHQ